MQLSNRDLGRLPLVLAYGVGPILALLQEAGLDPRLAELAGRGLWLVPAALGLALALNRDRNRERNRERDGERHRAAGSLSRTTLSVLVPAVAVAALAVLLALFPDWTSGLLDGAVLKAWLGEMAPLAWVGLAVLWAVFVATPSREDFLWAGSGLALLVMGDFISASFYYGRPVFSGGLLLPLDLVRVETHASLLLAAHLVGTGVSPEVRDSRRIRILRQVVLAGLLATFSRSALLAGVVAALALDPGPLKERFSTATSCALCALLPVFLPDAPAVAMDRFEARLEWISGVQWLMEKPAQLLTGYNPAELMDMSLPVSVGHLLLPYETLRLEATSIDSGWLRMLLIWGVWSWMALAAGAALMAPSCKDPRRRCLLALVLGAMLQGMFFAPLHHPGPAIALVLAMWTACRPPDTQT